MDLNLLCARHLSGNFAYIFSLKPLRNRKRMFSKGESKAQRAEIAYAVRAQCLPSARGKPSCVCLQIYIVFFQKTDIGYRLKISFMRYILKDVKKGYKVGWVL